MKIFDRYLFREFAGYVALGLAGFIVIFVVVDIFEKIDVFLDHHAPAALVTRFYLYRAPEVVVQVLPVALLLATFLALGQLNKFNELTAMRTAGWSLVRILRPVFAVGLFAALLSLLLGEYVVPGADRERNRIYDQQIQRIERLAATERADVTYLGQGGRIFFIHLYLVKEQRMHEVSLQEFRSGDLVRRIDAAEAAWDGDRWVFTSGYLRTFDHGREHAVAFDRIAVNGLAEQPADFAKESRKPEEMNYVELRSYVEKLRASGGRVANYLVDLHLKLAFPLINLIVVMIGASLATRLRMQSAALGFGLSIGIAFLFYGLMRTGQALGHNGALPPYLAAWMADLLFGAVGLAMLRQAQKS
ncbi:MAG: LPS export ABC transporter permease LptG [Candidatus Eisenbacteria bacterium]|nr:LPS export ABC transporter permease LptG [Candidatus Eisenbacteria bacterium]